MKTFFRLYNGGKSDLESTVFDLINGDLETKQTKGLAFIFKMYPNLFFEFVRILDVSGKYKKLKLDATALDVSAERFTRSGKRIDILVKVDIADKPCLAMIIEAKSVRLGVNAVSVFKQALGYLEPSELPDLVGYVKIPVVLTKYKTVAGNGVFSVSWNDLIELIERSADRKSGNIADQFYKFIVGVDREMNYYEREVLSIPAGISIDMVEKYFIYECPDLPAYNYKKPIFMTFRRSGGGEMNKLYKVADIVVLNPSVESDLLRLFDSDLDDSVKKRLSDFIGAMRYDALDHDKKFYILSESDVIDLPNKPRPPRNNAKFTYYRLADILSKTEVLPASKQDEG